MTHHVTYFCDRLTELAFRTFRCPIFWKSPKTNSWFGLFLQQNDSSNPCLKTKKRVDWLLKGKQGKFLFSVLTYLQRCSYGEGGSLRVQCALEFDRSYTIQEGRSCPSVTILPATPYSKRYISTPLLLSNKRPFGLLSNMWMNYDT